MNRTMKKIFSVALILLISLFASNAFAEEEASACETVAAGLCELCGEEFCAELEKTDAPTEEECAEILEGLEELATAAEALPEEEQDALGVALCEELAKGFDDEEAPE